MANRFSILNSQVNVGTFKPKPIHEFFFSFHPAVVRVFYCILLQQLKGPEMKTVASLRSTAKILECNRSRISVRPWQVSTLRVAAQLQPPECSTMPHGIPMASQPYSMTPHPILALKK